MPQNNWMDMRSATPVLSKAILSASVKGTVTPQDELVLLADRQLDQGDIRGALTLLTTAMEVCGTAFSERLAPTGVQSAVKFNPSKFFSGRSEGGKLHKEADMPPGLTKYLGIVGQLPATPLSALLSLWQTRHNIVHRGSTEISPARSIFSDVGPGDYLKFRAALSAAFVWMGYEPFH